ncbi:MAG: alpha/beta hydrolase [Candidatus Sedimenticola sp. 6PFRAG1]
MMRSLLTCALLCTCFPGHCDPEWELLEKAEERSLAVSEGELRFLTSPPEPPTHQHINQLSITPESLLDGWVSLNQCHRDIDPVAKAEITFRPGRIRNLQITQTENIERTQTGDSSVFMENIGNNATLCLTAETRALELMDGGEVELRNGPYMRRFLDGYYPMFISLRVNHPEQMVITDISPSHQPGLRVTKKSGEVALEGWFEGKLFTRLRFRPTTTGNR